MIDIIKKNDYKKDNHIEDDHIDDEHKKDNHIEDDYIDDEHKKDNHIEDDHIDDDHIEDDHKKDYDKNEKVKKFIEKKKCNIVKSAHYCYILQNHHNPDLNRTYNGYTVNPSKRIRQHNQEIKGGAKYTRIWGNKSWEMIVLIKGFPDHRNALQCEWKIKHPAPKKNRPHRYNSPGGRILGLNEILHINKWTSKSTFMVSDLRLEIWILKSFSHILTDLPESITLHVVNKIDLSNV